MNKSIYVLNNCLNQDDSILSPAAIYPTIEIGAVSSKKANLNILTAISKANKTSIYNVAPPTNIANNPSKLKA